MAENWQLKAVLSANSTGMVAALGNVNKMAKNTRKYLTDVASSAGNLGSSIGLPIAALSGILGGFSAVAIKNAMIGLTDMEDNLSKVSAATGMAAGEIKRMQYVAQVSNVPFESLVESTGKLNKNIHAAASGKNKNLAGLFQRLGISTRDANGELRSASDMLPQLAEAFKNNENPATRAAMGMAIYGKSWQNMIPLLADGAEKLAERNARFKELGLEVGDEAAYRKKLDAISKFGDKLDDLTFVSKGFQNTIATGLIPVIEPLLDGLIKWIVANKELIAIEVKQYVKDFTDFLKTIDWNKIKDGVKSFGASLATAIDWIGGAKNALILLAVVINAQTITAIMGMVGAIGRLGLFIVSLSWPVLAVAAGMTALAAAGVWVYQNWATVGPVLNGLFGPLIESVNGFIGSMGEMFSQLFNAFSKLASLLAPVVLPVLNVIAYIIGGVILGAVKLVTLGVIGLVKVLTIGLDIVSSIAGGIGAVVDSVRGWFGMVGGGKEAPVPAGNSPAPYPLPGDNLGSGRPYPLQGNNLGENRPSLLAPQQSASGGKFTFDFVNAPPGMRMTNQETKGPASVDMNVGWRSDALGMP